MLFTREYHWRLDPTVEQWQCWLSFGNNQQMTVVGYVVAEMVRDAVVDVKKFFVNDLRDQMGGLFILVEV